MSKIRQPRIFSKKITTSANEEVIVDRNYKGQLILRDFEIWNLSDNEIKVNINNSDYDITIEPNEGYNMGNDETFSCVIVTGGLVQFAGKY